LLHHTGSGSGFGQAQEQLIPVRDVGPGPVGEVPQFSGPPGVCH